jgi:hypothetical protein
MASSKIGPRGITIQDVQRVANNGLPTDTGETQYFYAPTQSTQPAFSAIDLASMLASKMQPGAGRKYAGYPTASMLQDAILGSALNFKDLGSYAATQANILGEPAQAAYLAALDNTDPKSLLSTQLRGNQSLLRQGISKDPYVSAAQAAYDKTMSSTGFAPGLGGATYSNVMGMSIPTGYSLGSNMTVSGKDAQARLATAQYAAQMKLLKNVYGDTTFTGGLNDRLESNALEQAKTQAETTRQAAFQSSGALRADEIARSIQDVPVSQLAQMMAASYGVDPNVARAMFGAQTDIDYARSQAALDAANSGVDTGMTEAEMILAYEGPEALIQWQQGKATAALYGTPEEQARAAQDENDAQSALFDLQVQTAYGVSPKSITGVDPQIARQLFMDTNFTGWIDAGIAELQNADGTKTPDQIVGEIGSKYLTAKPMGKVEAIALVEILSNWKFLANTGA